MYNFGVGQFLRMVDFKLTRLWLGQRTVEYLNACPKALYRTQGLGRWDVQRAWVSNCKRRGCCSEFCVELLMFTLILPKD